MRPKRRTTVPILIVGWLVMASSGMFSDAASIKVLVTSVQAIVALNSGSGMAVRWTNGARTPSSSAWIGQVKKIEFHAEPETDLIILVLHGKGDARIGSLHQRVEQGSLISIA